MAKKYTERFENFRKSLESLGQMKSRDLSDDFVISGVVQKYCLTFDISWKVMKDIIINYHQVTSFATGSPRETLRTARSVALIEDDIWMEMLKDRNNLAHDYDGSLAQEAVERIGTVYLPVFKKFENTAEQYIGKMKREDIHDGTGGSGDFI